MEINNLELVSVVEDIPLEYLRRNNYTKCLEIYNARAFNWSDGVYGRWDNLNIIPEVFASKCKKWALSWKYIITPVVILSGANYLKYLVEVKSFHNPSIDRKAFSYFRAYNSPKIYNSEEQAIIDVCEWILKELKK